MNPGKYWGAYDPHFNELDIKYAEFLSEKIIKEINNKN